MSEEERAAQRKGDEIDEIDTTDLEKDDYIEHEEGESLMDSGAISYMADNRINLARAFLGYDGGYSIRKLKKFYKQSLDGKVNEEGQIVRGRVEPEGSDAEPELPPSTEDENQPKLSEEEGAEATAKPEGE